MTYKMAAMERERTERYKAYLKIVSEIATVQDPHYDAHTYPECDPDKSCHYCDAEMMYGLGYTFVHEDNCLWIRSKELVEMEPK